MTPALWIPAAGTEGESGMILYSPLHCKYYSTGKIIPPMERCLRSRTNVFVRTTFLHFLISSLDIKLSVVVVIPIFLFKIPIIINLTGKLLVQHSLTRESAIIHQECGVQGTKNTGETEDDSLAKTVGLKHRILGYS